MKRSILSVIGALAGTALLFGTSACSSTASAEPAPVPTTQTAGAFPRTIVVDGADMTIAEQPQRVLAISSDVADVALQLIGPERMIAVPQYIHSEFTSTQSKLAVQVENALSSSTGADPEQFLALDPDLVLVTTRHTSEEDAFSMLEQAGIPTVAVHNGWDSPDLYRENVRLLGDVLGAEDEAQQLIEQFDARTQAVTDAVASLSDEEKPLTIVLRYLGAGRTVLHRARRRRHSAVHLRLGPERRRHPRHAAPGVSARLGRADDADRRRHSAPGPTGRL